MKFRRGGASAYVESLKITILYKNREFGSYAIHYKNPGIFIVLEMNVHRSYALRSHSGLDDVYQVQAYLVFVRKLVSLNTNEL